MAHDGREAVELLEREPVDLVLMDVHMPEMNGVQATIEIRSRVDSSMALLPIVAISAHNSREDQERCLAAGMDAFLPKPIDMHRLIEMIENLCGAESEAYEIETQPAAALDCDAIIRRLDGDVNLFLQFVRDFWNDVTPLVEQARAAIKQSSGTDLQTAAAALEALFSTLGSQAGVIVAACLRAKALGVDLLGAEVELEKLEQLVAQLKSRLAAYCATLTAAGQRRSHA